MHFGCDWHVTELCRHWLWEQLKLQPNESWQGTGARTQNYRHRFVALNLILFTNHPVFAYQKMSTLCSGFQVDNLANVYTSVTNTPMKI
jgi:hypothetical protein